MKTKFLMWGVVVSALTAGMAEDTNQLSKADSPQVIHFDDHTTLTLLGTTYGHRHAPPGYENFGDGGYTANQFVVWIKAEHEPGKRPNYELLVSDRANTGCVNIWGPQPRFVNDSVSLQSFVLSAFPRWDKETILRVKPYQGSVSKEHFVITNPAPVAVDNWIPKPLPDMESDGDLAVTLTKLVAGAPTPSGRGGTLTPTNDPIKQCVHLNFDFRQNGQSATNWQAWPVQTTDASGNWSRGLIYGYPKNGINPSYPDRIHPSFPPERDGYYFQPGLWPAEPWKSRLEFIQRAGFTEDQIVTFTNLPVRSGTQQDHDDEWTWEAGNTNFAFVAQGSVSGTRLKLLPPLWVPSGVNPGQKFVSVILYADSDFDPQGMNLTFLQATDETGREVWNPFGPRLPWAGHYSLELPNVREIKTLNLKLALHKSRFVEFTVKPTKQ